MMVSESNWKNTIFSSGIKLQHTKDLYKKNKLKFKRITNKDPLIYTIHFSYVLAGSVHFVRLEEKHLNL